VIPPPKAARPRSSRRRRRFVIAAVVLLLLAASTIGGIKFAHYVNRHYFSHVPKVTGETRAAAVARLEQAGYQVPPEKVYSAYSNTVAKGRVINTDPPAGEQLTTGKEVALTVSSGPKLYAIPRVRGDSYDAALDALTRLGLTIADTPRKRYDDTVPTGDVVGTSPPVGHQVSEQQTITIITSLGPPIVKVPSIPQGTPVDEAKHTLRKSAGKFNVDTQEEFNDAVGVGEVVRIEPSDHAVKGSTITVTVSKGPEMVKVPSIHMGMSVAQAEEAIQEAGLVPDVRPFGGSGTPVTVLAISPDAGTLVRSGSKVVVYALTG